MIGDEYRGYLLELLLTKIRTVVEPTAHPSLGIPRSLARSLSLCCDFFVFLHLFPFLFFSGRLIWSHFLGVFFFLFRRICGSCASVYGFWSLAFVWCTQPRVRSFSSSACLLHCPTSSRSRNGWAMLRCMRLTSGKLCIHSLFVELHLFYAPSQLSFAHSCHRMYVDIVF